MARAIVDLHPDDFTVRDQLRRQLRALREQQQVSQATLADRIGTNQASVRRLERKGVLQSRTSTVARWARGLGHELVMEPVDLPRPVQIRRPSRTRDADEMLAMLVHSTQLGGTEWQAARLVSELGGIRVAAGVTQLALADRLNLTEQTISFFEGGTVDNAIVVLQRYTRAVARCSRWRAGRLDVRLEPIVTGPRLTGVSGSVDTGELVRST